MRRLAVAVALVVGLAACGRPSADPPRRILLLLADTLRADHVDAEHMPELWRYFADGTRFDAAYSTATWTLPSVASLFSGRLPIELRAPDGTLIAIPEGITSLADELAARGFATAAVTANWTVNRENGFARGFEHFHAPFDREPGEAKRRVSWPAPGAEWVIEHAESILRQVGDRNLFLYLHFMEPHDPYRNHETGELFPAPNSGATPTPEELARLRRAYASEVRRLDRHLAAFLERTSSFDLVVFTSDHGEEFAEHGGFRHGLTVYPEVARVPLLMRGVGIDRGIVSRPTSLVHLRSFLLGSATELLEPGSALSIETFSHAPPRWSRIADARQAVLLARPLGAGQPEDPLAAWLLEHHPPIVFADLGGRPQDLDELPAADLLGGLMRHFAGFRRGLYLLFPPGGRWQVEIADAATPGWWWGDAATCELAESGADTLLLEVSAADPFALVFLPVDGESVSVLSTASGATIRQLAGPPREVPRSATHWLDPGRPPPRLSGIEESLERLRALGYL